MPKQTVTKTVYPIDPEKCRAVRHIPRHLFPLYDLMVGFATAGRISKFGRDSESPLVFTASFMPTVCNALNISENTAYSQRDKLKELGWIALQKEGGYNQKAKHRLPDEWLVLEHKDFIKRNPNSCPPRQYPEHVDEEGIQVRKDGPGVAVRFLGTSPLMKAIVEVVDEFAWLDVLAHWNTNIENSEEPVSDEERAVHERYLKQFRSPLPTGDSQSPIDRGQPIPCGASDLSPVERESFPLSSKEPFPCGAGDQSPADRGTSSKTPVKTPAKTTHTTPRPSLADQKSITDQASECVGVLLSDFVALDGDVPRVSNSEKKQLVELAKQHGSENFRAAGRAWLKSHPWNNATTNPFITFINGFTLYLKKIDLDKKAESAKMTPDEIKAATEKSMKLRDALFRPATDVEPDIDIDKW